jgi:hypothetical protein
VSVREYIEANSGRFFTALTEWLAIPSAYGAPERADDVAHSVRLTLAQLAGHR